MDEHPNAGRVRETLDAWNRGDLEAMSASISENVVWHVGGDHPLSGDYHGREAVLEYCAKVLELTGGTLLGEPIDVLVSDRHAGIFNRLTGERDGKRLDVVLAQALTFDENGLWTEYWALADGQAEVDAFWAGAR